jgi:hypothetical protein
MKTLLLIAIITVSLAGCQIGRVNTCDIGKYTQQLTAGMFKGCWKVGR